MGEGRGGRKEGKPERELESLIQPFSYNFWINA